MPSLVRVGMAWLPDEVLDAVLEQSLRGCLEGARSDDVARVRALAWFRCVAPVCSAFADTARLLLYATIEIAIGRVMPPGDHMRRLRRAALVPNWRLVATGTPPHACPANAADAQDKLADVRLAAARVLGEAPLDSFRLVNIAPFELELEPLLLNALAECATLRDVHLVGVSAASLGDLIPCVVQLRRLDHLRLDIDATTSMPAAVDAAWHKPWLIDEPRCQLRRLTLGLDARTPSNILDQLRVLTMSTLRSLIVHLGGASAERSTGVVKIAQRLVEIHAATLRSLRIDNEQTTFAHGAELAHRCPPWTFGRVSFPRLEALELGELAITAELFDSISAPRLRHLIVSPQSSARLVDILVQKTRPLPSLKAITVMTPARLPGPRLRIVSDLVQHRLRVVCRQFAIELNGRLAS